MDSHGIPTTVYRNDNRDNRGQTPVYVQLTTDDSVIVSPGGVRRAPDREPAREPAGI